MYSDSRHNISVRIFSDVSVMFQPRIFIEIFILISCCHLQLVTPVSSAWTDVDLESIQAFPNFTGTGILATKLNLYLVNCHFQPQKSNNFSCMLIIPGQREIFLKSGKLQSLETRYQHVEEDLIKQLNIKRTKTKTLLKKYDHLNWQF